MNNRTVPDLEVNSSVRRVFVRHQIDLGWLSFHTCRGTVYIQGDLLLLPGVSPELTPIMVGGLFDEIGCVSGVCNLIVELRNWRHNSLNTGWQLATDVVSRRFVSSASTTSNTFEISGT
jgi:hypothetical protein